MKTIAGVVILITMLLATAGDAKAGCEIVGTMNPILICDGSKSAQW